MNEDWTLKVTYNQVWWPILGMCAPFKVDTHSSEHTHTPRAVGSHLCCSTQGAVGGLVPWSRAPHRGIEGGESAVHSLNSPTIPAGPRFEPATFRLQVQLSNIRPQLPHDCSPWRFELTSDSNLSHSFWLNYLVAAVKIPMQGKMNNASFLFITQRHQKACS